MTTKADVELQPDQVDGSTDQAEGTLKTEPLTLEALQAQLKERDALIAKQANDLKARDGQRRKQSDLDNTLADFGDELRAHRKVFMAYADAMHKGDSDALPAELSKIEQESGASRGSRQRQARYETVTARLVEVVTGEDNNSLLTDEQAAEIQKVWTEAGRQAFATGDFSSLHDVVLDASKIVLKNQREAAKAEKLKLEKEGKEQTKKALERAGVYDLSTGGATGGRAGGITSWAQAQKIKKVTDLTDAAYEKLIAEG